jgi:hypothetical protein
MKKPFKWVEAETNDKGILTIAIEVDNRHNYVGYNGILKGDTVVYQEDGKEYKIAMVSKIGRFGLSETGKLPCTILTLPTFVYKKEEFESNGSNRHHFQPKRSAPFLNSVKSYFDHKVFFRKSIH